MAGTGKEDSVQIVQLYQAIRMWVKNLGPAWFPMTEQARFDVRKRQRSRSSGLSYKYICAY